MSLIDVCYEQIKDNFWYGLFGDFKLIIDKDTGYFNATKLCSSGGKRFDNWSRLDCSKTLMRYYEQKLATSHVRGLNPVYTIFPNGTNLVDLQICGTYIREELLLNLASWLSNSFYDKCYVIIRDYYTRDFKKLKSDKEQLENHVREIENSMNELKLENIRLKIDMTKPTGNEMKHPQFVLIRKNNEMDLYPYYVLRRQKGSRDSRLSEIEEYFPDYEIVLAFTVKNGVTIYNKLKETGNIKCEGNHFSTQLTEEQLIRLILDIHSGV